MHRRLRERIIFNTHCLKQYTIIDDISLSPLPPGKGNHSTDGVGSCQGGTQVIRDGKQFSKCYKPDYDDDTYSNLTVASLRMFHLCYAVNIPMKTDGKHFSVYYKPDDDDDILPIPK
jgi:hypothetical protein